MFHIFDALITQPPDRGLDVKKKKKPAQRNHEGCFIPPGLEAYSSSPVYIIVALWCLSKKTWVNRSDVSRAFKMSTRKASFQLSYLMKKKDIIDCDVRRVRSEGIQTPCNEFRVNAVSLKNTASAYRPPSKPLAGVRRNQVGNASESQRELLRELWSGRKKKEKE